MTAIGKIDVVPVREAFRHEAYNFTAWLEGNIDALSERLGIQLTVLEREKTVGPFSLDLLCQDEEEQRVIIENQLEATDHRHLGQVLTYLVNLDAKTAIWVVTEARGEHTRVVEWLNENTAEDMAFYLVKVEAIRISGSPYAPLFTALVQPDARVKQIGKVKKEITEQGLSETQQLFQAFWSELLQQAEPRLTVAPTRTTMKRHWVSVPTGRSGVVFNFGLNRRGAYVDLYIDTRDADKNKTLFDTLYTHQQQIEQEFGASLDWRRLDEKRASRIVYEMTNGSLRQPDTWQALQSDMIEAMIRLDQVFRSQLAHIHV